MPIKTLFTTLLRVDDKLEREARALLDDMRDRSVAEPSRELSLAITNLEQSILWLKVANRSTT